MKNAFVFIFSILFITSCFDEVVTKTPSQYRQTQSNEGVRMARMVRGYFKRNANNMQFMHCRQLNFVDLKYGLIRKYSNDEGVFLEIPVIRGLLNSNKREDWIMNQTMRASVLVQLDNDENITKINYIEQNPTEEYYNQHSKLLYYDMFTGVEDVYDVENKHIGSFGRLLPLSRTTWLPDSNGVYPGDTIPEVIITGHNGGGGIVIIPGTSGSDISENDTISNQEPICEYCGATKEYDNVTNGYYCPVCNSITNTSGANGGSSNSESQTLPTTISHTKVGFIPKGYLTNYKNFEKISQLPENQKVRLFNPVLDADKNIAFIKRTPDVVIGQSTFGCVPACINHLLLSFGSSVIDEFPVWKNYYENIFSQDNLGGYSLKMVMETGINDIYM